MRFSPVLSLILLGSGPSVVGQPPPPPPKLTVTFTGHSVVGALNMPANRTEADEVRIILVNSDYVGNENVHKMTHLPAIEFLSAHVSPNPAQPCVGNIGSCTTAPCWAPQQADYLRYYGTEAWCGWYLHDTGVSFGGTPSKITLQQFDYMRTPEFAQNKTDPALGRLENLLWDTTDPYRRRIGARVAIPHGTIRVTKWERNVESAGRPPFDMATAFEWTSSTASVVLSPLAGPGADSLVIPLARDTSARVRNSPTRHPHHPKYASHFPEFVDFTAAVDKPDWVDRAQPYAPGFPAHGDAFCPPVVLGRP